MKRRFRLTRSADFKRVWRSGKSYAHPLLVLSVLKSDRPETQVGVSAGLAVGNAVKRNRAKRLLREAMNGLLPQTITGFDLVLTARRPLSESDVGQTYQVLSSLLVRAGLLSSSHDG